MSPASFRSRTGMPAALRRSVEPLELETAPAMRSLLAASSSMRKFTVDPVPTPSTSPGTTNSSAARAAACFPVFCSLLIDVSAAVDGFADGRNDTARLERAVSSNLRRRARESLARLIDKGRRITSSWLSSWPSSWLSPWLISSSYGLVRGRVYAGVDKFQASVTESEHDIHVDTLHREGINTR